MTSLHHSASAAPPPLEALVRDHAASLRRHVRYVYPYVDADEVVNQTFTIAWRHIHEVPAGAEHLWLRRVARNVVLNTNRSQRRWRALKTRVALLTPVPQVAAPDDPVQIELRRVMAALDRLSAADREVLLIAALEEESAEGVAQILDIRPAAARQRLSRARARLRREVEADGGDEVVADG
jgi:RNA polymerase sigma-70 factor (ECF subfamily)